MLFSLSTMFVVALFALLASADKAVAGSLLTVRDVQLTPYSYVEKRTSPVKLGTIDVSTSIQNKQLFSVVVGVGNNIAGGQVQFDLHCVDCRTWGVAVIMTTGVSKNNSIIGDVGNFFKNPEQTIINALDVNLEVSLAGIGGHFEFGITTSGTVSHTIPIFLSETPVGVALSPDLTVGLVFILDLTFALGASVDMQAGFEVLFPPGANILIDPLSGDIVSSNFAGATADGLPVTVTNGKATFIASLKARVQVGSTVKLFGTGFDFEMGLFLNLVQYTAEFTSTGTCPLSINHFVDIDVGAFAKAAVAVDFVNFGIQAPSVVTTLFIATLPSLCASVGKAKKTTAAITKTISTIKTSSGAKAVKTTTPSLPSPRPTSFTFCTTLRSPATLSAIATPIIVKVNTIITTSSISHTKSSISTSYTPLNPGLTIDATSTSTAASWDHKTSNIQTTKLSISPAPSKPLVVVFTSVDVNATSTGSLPAKFTGSAARLTEGGRSAVLAALAVAGVMFALS